MVFALQILKKINLRREKLFRSYEVEKGKKQLNKMGFQVVAACC